MRVAAVLAGALLAAAMPALAADAGPDLEPARDALRRHEYERAAALLARPADAGDPEAGFMLAQLLRFGRGVGQDLPRACGLLERSAAAGYPRAAVSLATLLEAGDCKQSIRTAAQWRELAAAGGHSPPPVKASAQPLTAMVTPESLLRAARAGDLAELRGLLLQIPVDVADEYGRTPLMLAAEAIHPEVVRELLRHGANVKGQDRNGDSALLLAVRSASSECVDLLLSAGAPPDLANGSGVTPLMVAARAGSTSLAERLLSAGADPGRRDAAGLRAGDFATRSGHAELGRRLGATRPSAPSGPVVGGALYAGRSLLMIAAERGDMKLLQERIAAGDDVNAGDIRGMSALAIAAGAGKAEAVERLLAAGASIDARDSNNWTALGHALRAGQPAASLVLIHAGADAVRPQGAGETPLALAVGSRQAGLVAPLVAAGARVDSTDAGGVTPLIAAAAAGDDDCVASLLAAGARTELTDRRGRTALWLAANKGALAAVRRLAGKSPVDTGDADGSTPLAAAAAKGFDEVMRALLTAGADARVASSDGNLPLHVAAAAGRAGAVALLARRSGDVNRLNRNHDTALILSVKARCVDCARILLAAGASTRLRNSDSLTAADVARLTGDPALVQLLD